MPAVSRCETTRETNVFDTFSTIDSDEFTTQNLDPSIPGKERHAVSDSILLRVAAGDHAAVQECMDCFGGLVWSLARRMTLTTVDAEDAAQEIFVDLWKSASNFDPNRASAATFVTMIARRRLIDQFRRRSRQPVSTKLEALHEPPVDAESTVEDQDEFQSVIEHMSKLRAEERQVIRLAIIEGRTQREIADVLDMPIGTVKTNARRGLQKLREMSLPRDDRQQEVDHA